MKHHIFRFFENKKQMSNKLTLDFFFLLTKRVCELIEGNTKKTNKITNSFIENKKHT